MKKFTLAAAVAIASIATAHATPTVYGKIFLSLDYTDTDDKTSKNNDTTKTELASHASRIGFKGSEKLTDNTDVVYQLEYAVNPDNDSQQFGSRNTFLGVSHKQYGSVFAGRHDTPFRLAKGGVDVFNAYNELALHKADVVGEVRANSVIAYKSPKLDNLPITFTGAVLLSEQTANSLAGTRERNTKDNGYSASVVYDKDGIYLAGAYDNNSNVNTTPVLELYIDKAWRIAGSVDLGKLNMVQGLTLGALYQDADIYDYSSNSKSWLVSGKYAINSTPWVVKAQYINTSFNNVDTDEVAVGAEYTFNKATTAHLYAGQIKKENASDTTIVSAGIEYKF